MVAVMGAPATGKTTLTLRLGQAQGYQVFRIREHVPDTILAAAATSVDQPERIDDVTVVRALRGYVERVVFDASIHTVLLDDFPGSGTQARLLLGVLRRLAPACAVHAVELVADRRVRDHRVATRRVCHRCERDPVHDPRIPAQASRSDPNRCARCGGVLHPRRGDAPRLLVARTQHYAEQALGIRATFAEAGITVLQLDASRSVETLAAELRELLVVSGARP